MTSTLETLAAKQDIYEVLVRYCRGIDRLDEALVRSCYQPGAVDNHGIYNGSVDLFVENAFRRQRTLVFATHSIHNVSIDIEGDAAVCEAYATAVERNALDSGLVDNVVGLRYVDRFERQGGGPWLIARRTVVIDWSRAHAVDEGWVGQATFARGARDRSDPVYAETALLRP